MSLTNKVEHGEALFILVKTQSAPKLLKKNGETLCRSKQNNRIKFRDIDALVVEIDDEDKVD
jgi:hypothetical protein